MNGMIRSTIDNRKFMLNEAFVRSEWRVLPFSGSGSPCGETTIEHILSEKFKETTIEHILSEKFKLWCKIHHETFHEAAQRSFRVNGSTVIPASPVFYEMTSVLFLHDAFADVGELWSEEVFSTLN